MSGSPTHSVGPHLFKRLTYEPMRDVPPVAMIAVAPNLLVAKASLPVKSLADLIALAREKPGQLTYSSAGNGTSGHLAAELVGFQRLVDTLLADFAFTRLRRVGGGAIEHGERT